MDFDAYILGKYDAFSQPSGADYRRYSGNSTWWRCRAGAALDLRFESKEKAILGQSELGLGLLPGGGGLHLLPRLTGRGRTLEIVLGADDVDADTAALYGSIRVNRAIPDHQFDHFVDKFARRVASWDHYAITMAKKIINGATGFPKVEEVTSDYNAFQATFGQGVVAQRAQALIASGLQTIEKFEINAAEEVLRFAGNGPWDSE
ncbi:hypothetical protein CHU98_g8403 [Xylaria longipes]|nr:hypothetical protein CHU98_g8403 [Xylaria longipes]